MKKSILTFCILLSALFVSCDRAKEKTIVTTAVDSVYDPESSAANQRAEQEEAESESDCLERTEATLPYQKLHNPEKVNYQLIPCEIDGIEDFRCEHKGVRYIPLPKSGDVEVILVPMDCGDFNYRYYLLTILNRKVVANQYVEGEWFEPGDEAYREVTSFQIDERYRISVQTKKLENGKEASTETHVFELRPDGHLSKAD